MSEERLDPMLEFLSERERQESLEQASGSTILLSGRFLSLKEQSSGLDLTVQRFRALNQAADARTKELRALGFSEEQINFEMWGWRVAREDQLLARD